MKKYQIYGLGAALVDIVVSVTDEFLSINKLDKGIMTLVDEDRQFYLLSALKQNSRHVKSSSGGSACNSIVAASCFGLKTFYSGKVADDAYGKFFIEDLKAANVDFLSTKASFGVTGTCLVMVTDDAERTMNTFLGANLDLTSSEVDSSVLIDSDWLYLEGYLVTDKSRSNVVLKAIELAKENDVKISFSLSDPFVAELFLERLLKVIGNGVDLLFCNSDEAKIFTHTNNIKDAAEQLKKYAKTFSITLGAMGSLTYDGFNLIETPAIPTDALDTNGAGDMYAGAFLYAINAGHNYSLAAKFANAASARVVRKFGPRLDTSEYDEIKQQFNM